MPISAEQWICVENNMPAMHSHEYYEMYFLLSGKRDYTTNNSFYHIEEGSLVITEPHRYHLFSSGSFERILLIFGRLDLSPTQAQFIDTLCRYEVMQLPPPAMKKACFLLKKILSVQNGSDNDKLVHVALIFGQLLALVYDCAVPHKSSISLKDPLENNTAPIILRVITYINQHFTEKIKLDNLCDMFRISKTWLNKCFFEKTHMTVIEYKISLQLNKVKRLLMASSLSLKEIAEKTGFKSSNYLNIVFKQHIKMSPKEYVKRNKQYIINYK